VLFLDEKSAIFTVFVNKMPCNYLNINLNHHPFGTQMSGRRLLSAKAKYGFNGKEKDNEDYGEGNAYNFGSRIYDSRLARWWSSDPKSKKYPTWSPYHFGFCSPIVTIDIDGEENIVIVASQHDNSAGNKLMFMNQALRQVIGYSKDEKSESRTVLLFTEGYTDKQIKRFKEQVKKYGGTVQEVNSAKAVENYINSKQLSSGEVGDARSADKVSNVDAFSHGVPGSIEFGYDMENKENAKFTKTNAMNLDPKAFDQGAVFTSYACRTGAGEDLNRFINSGDSKPDKSLAQAIANSAQITVKAFMTRSDYSSTLGTSMERKFYSMYKDSKYLQTVGYWKLDYKLFKTNVDNREIIDKAAFTTDGAWKPVTGGTTPLTVPNNLKTFTPKISSNSNQKEEKPTTGSNTQGGN